LSLTSIEHYKEYLNKSWLCGERDTSNDPWDPMFNHRAEAGEPHAIDGTHDEMLVEAMLFSASGKDCERITDKQMQMYGQDLKHDGKLYSVKNRFHNVTPFNDYIIDLYDADFKPGLYRIHKIAFVDRQGMIITLVSYRHLAQHCCTISDKNIPKKLLKRQLSLVEFEQKFPSTADTYDLNKEWV
jgi:hypothetical protein